MFDIERELQKPEYEQDIDAIRARMSQVHDAQAVLQMAPRTDSRLTLMYATGHLNATAREVAHELMCVDHIMGHTNYDQIIEESMRRIAAYVKSTYKIDWTSTWEIVRKYVPTALKMHSVRAYYCQMPDQCVSLDAQIEA